MLATILQRINRCIKICCIQGLWEGRVITMTTVKFARKETLIASCVYYEWVDMSDSQALLPSTFML